MKKPKLKVELRDNTGKEINKKLRKGARFLDVNKLMSVLKFLFIENKFFKKNSEKYLN